MVGWLKSLNVWIKVPVTPSWHDSLAFQLCAHLRWFTEGKLTGAASSFWGAALQSRGQQSSQSTVDGRNKSDISSNLGCGPNIPTDSLWNVFYVTKQEISANLLKSTLRNNFNWPDWSNCQCLLYTSKLTNIMFTTIFYSGLFDLVSLCHLHKRA